jgi:5'-nucleotidase
MNKVQQLVVAISSRALFDFEDENQLFETEGDQAYMRLQLSRLDVPAKRGVAFPLIKKLMAFNTPDENLVEVVILSRNDPVSGMRVFKSAQAESLDVKRGVFIKGRPPFPYLKPLGATLFLSAKEDDVREALKSGYPAARVYPLSSNDADHHPNEVRIAFDGDAVLFSDEAEIVYLKSKLAGFQQHEKTNALNPLPEGPFKPFLSALNVLQDRSKGSNMKIRTALVTARSAPSHERAIRTLMSWDIHVDEAMFLGGLPKTDYLKEFEPDFFFDDQTGHCEDAAKNIIPTGHVVSGIKNIK